MDGHFSVAEVTRKKNTTIHMLDGFMIIERESIQIFKVGESWVIPDVLGVKYDQSYSPGDKIHCILRDPKGNEAELVGEVSLDLVHNKNYTAKREDVGGSVLIASSENLKIFHGGLGVFTFPFEG